jgi:hypothetical protein
MPVKRSEMRTPRPYAPRMQMPGLDTRQLGLRLTTGRLPASCDLVPIGSNLVASSMAVSQSPFSHAPGKSPPQFEPRGQESQPATRGDIDAVIAELREIRGVLEQIRDGLEQRPSAG